MERIVWRWEGEEGRWGAPRSGQRKKSREQGKGGAMEDRRVEVRDKRERRMVLAISTTGNAITG